MNPRVKELEIKDNYTLLLTFTNNEVKLFDAKPYLNIGVFKELKDIEVFNTAKVNLGSVSWKNGQDLCPDTLYIEGKTISIL